jgi:hypothetical protein
MHDHPVVQVDPTSRPPNGELIDVALSPVAIVLLFLLGLTVQLRYLDRIALRVGRPEPDTSPRT